MAKDMETKAGGETDAEAAAAEAKAADLINQALKAHGLRPGDCLATRVQDGTAVLVTKGGQKIRWRAGDMAVSIPDHQRPDARPRIRKKGEA